MHSRALKSLIGPHEGVQQGALRPTRWFPLVDVFAATQAVGPHQSLGNGIRSFTPRCKTLVGHATPKVRLVSDAEAPAQPWRHVPDPIPL